MTALQHALNALDDLRERYCWLEDSVHNGTPRPYRAPTLDAEQQAAADAAARAERHERVNIAPGDSPDPYHFDTVDLRDTILATADAMAEHIAQTAGVDRLPDASWGDHAGLWIVYAARYLGMAAEAAGETHGAVLVEHVRHKAQQLVHRADMLLGNMTDGQTLDVECFVCQSRTDQHPTGGGRTLRFRIRHQAHRAGEPCLFCRSYVVCESGRCEPSSEQCGYRHRGHPAWDLATEAQWLADRLGATPQQPTCERCDAPIVRVSSGPTPHRYCTVECHRQARADQRREARAA